MKDRYVGEALESHFEQCYEKSLHTMEAEFISYIQRFKQDEILEQRIHALLLEGGIVS